LTAANFSPSAVAVRRSQGRYLKDQMNIEKSTGVSARSEAATDVASPAVVPSAETERKETAELLRFERAEKDWLDYVVAFFAFVASLAAIMREA
jgi:hypothetical protein